MPTPLKWISIFAYLLLVVGFVKRRRRRIHIPLMVSAFVIDMAIVLYIELTRGAIETAREKMGLLMIVHICLSVTAIFFYLGQIITGLRKARGHPIRWHHHGGIGLLVARLGNLITSFMIT